MLLTFHSLQIISLNNLFLFNCCSRCFLFSFPLAVRFSAWAPRSSFSSATLTPPEVFPWDPTRILCSWPQVTSALSISCCHPIYCREVNWAYNKKGNSNNNIIYFYYERIPEKKRNVSPVIIIINAVIITVAIISQLLSKFSGHIREAEHSRKQMNCDFLSSARPTGAKLSDEVI